MTEHMYTELAAWWPLLSPVDEYKEEAELYREALMAFAPRAPRTLLELGAGGGHNAFYLKRAFALTLVDLSEAMLRQSRRINPEVTHHVGDMRDVRLGEVFDAVFIHDAITYMTTRDDLKRAMETAFAHCAPGGVALFVPDETKERFVPDTSCGGSDEGALGFRYMEWVWDPDPSDETIVTDYAFLIRDAQGDTRVVHERHTHGLFPHQVWLDTMAAVGFEPHCKVCEHSELPDGYAFFIGIKR
jgi:SAM-dependent methyltransferase